MNILKPSLLCLAATLLAAAAVQAQGVSQVWTASTASPNPADPVVTAAVNTDGSYSLALNGVSWLASAETGLSIGGVFYSQPATSGGQLLVPDPLAPSAAFTGTDPRLGNYQAFTEYWLAGTTHFQTEFRVFQSLPAVVFEQRFPDGVGASAYTNGVSSSFPSFQTASGKATTLRYLTFNDGFAAPVQGFGLNNIPTTNGQYGFDYYGIQGGSPLAILDDSVGSLPTMLFSPLTNFKAGVQTRQNQLSGHLACGIQGQITNIPAGFAHDTILYGGQGVNNTFYNWGSTLLGYYGVKDHSAPSRDFNNNYLGYWTDRGSYYYYSFLPNPNSQTQANTVDTTLLNIQADANNHKIPYRYYQLDSWWYYRDSGGSGGTSNWDSQLGAISGSVNRFPQTGSVGALNTQMVAQNAGVAMPWTLHNRHWATDNIYATQNGGQYIFYQSSVDCPNDRSGANNPLFWPYLLGRAASTYKAGNYEQDWLRFELLNCTPLRQGVYTARNWLQDMGASAANNGLTIQYCQVLGSDYLESVEIPAVTEIRASGDYFYTNNNWDIGGTSMLAWAVGLVPFKDTFWTGSSEPGGHTQIDGVGTTESNPSLQTLVATLSAGPVGPGDGIGDANASLLMKTCNQSGLLLKPDKPATSIDSTYTSHAPAGKICSTYSDQGPSHRWYYVDSLGLSSAYSLTTADVPITGPAVVYNYRTGAIVGAFNPGSLSIPTTSSYDYNYYVIAPKEASGYAFLGETGKFVTVSAQRFQPISGQPSVSSDGLTVTETGAPGETTQTSWYAPTAPLAYASTGTTPSSIYTNQVFTVTSTIPASGVMTIHVVAVPPAAPANLTAAPGTGSAVLSWNAVPNATAYNVKRSTTSGSGYVTIGTTGATNFTDSGLVNGGTYYYVVSALDTGVEGANSNEASANIAGPPAAPSNLTATIKSATEIDLAWTDNSSNETGFNITRSDGTNNVTFTAAANATTYQDTTAAPGNTYTYQVQAIGDAGNSTNSNPVAVHFDVPAAPSNLQAPQVSSTSVTLTWTDNADNESGFIVERAPDNTFATVTAITTTQPNITTCTDSSVSAGSTYYYRVRATNPVGDSANVVLGPITITAVPPAAPSGLTVTSVSSTKVSLSWTNNAGSSATGFNVYRSTNGGVYALLIPGGAAPTVGAGVTSFNDAVIVDGNVYSYNVTAVGSGGESSASNIVTANIQPLAPSALSAAIASATQVALSWTNNSSANTGYKLERSTSSTFSTVTLVATIANRATTSYTDSPATKTVYFYRVRATSAAGDSANSGAASVHFAVPAVPTSPQAVKGSSTGQIQVTWTDASDNESAFYVYRSTSSNGTYAQVSTVNSSTTGTTGSHISFTDTGLTSGHKYYYKVLAHNLVGNSSLTSSVNATAR